jgi:hypothetical protein
MRDRNGVLLNIGDWVACFPYREGPLELRRVTGHRMDIDYIVVNNGDTWHYTALEKVPNNRKARLVKLFLLKLEESYE